MRFRPLLSAAIESVEQPASPQQGAPLPAGFLRMMSLRDGGPLVRVLSVLIPRAAGNGRFSFNRVGSAPPRSTRDSPSTRGALPTRLNEANVSLSRVRYT